MALEHTYQQYKNKAAFFVVYLGERDPQGYWLNVSDTVDLQARAQQAKNCPSTQGLNIPRLLDDIDGTADFLYRARPFQVYIIDVDGNIAYHSADNEADHARTDLDVPIRMTLDALFANRGRVTAQMVAKERSDRAGARATGFWLPRVEYFTETAPPAHSTREARVKITDARGYVIEVPKSLRDRLKYQRKQVARLFTPGVPQAKKPVVLTFINAESSLTAPVLEAWYQVDRQLADFYLIYADKSGASMPERAQVAKSFLVSTRLTIPCLLDGPENDVTFAYGGQMPRLVVIDQRQQVRYVSAPGAEGFMRGIGEARGVLNGIHAR